MTLNNFKFIVEQFEEKVTNLILYFQGEPFLNPQFINIIKYASSKKIYTQTSTNAQNIDNKLAENIVLSQLNHIIISIDGIDQNTYSKYREGGKLEKCINTIKLINNYKKIYNSKLPFIETQMLVFSYNEHQIEQFKKLSKQWGANKSTLKTAQIYDINDNVDLIPTNKKYSRYKNKNGIWDIKKNKKNKCWRVWSGAVINVDGELLPCCYDKNCDYSYGNVFSFPISILWNNKKAVLFRNTILKNKKAIYICNNCM